MQRRVQPHLVLGQSNERHSRALIRQIKVISNDGTDVVSPAPITVELFAPICRYPLLADEIIKLGLEESVDTSKLVSILSPPVNIILGFPYYQEFPKEINFLDLLRIMR